MLWDREREVRTIADAIGLTAGGEGGVVVLRGPAGIGKSSLLRQAQQLAEQQGLVVLRARAAPFERDFPFGVVRQLFEPTLARRDVPTDDLLSGAAAGARAVLGDEPGPLATLDSSFASFHALYWLTANLAAFAPLLISVDDVVWSDEASLRFLGFLVRRLQGMPVMIALAYRGGEPEPDQLLEVLAADPLVQLMAPAPLGENAVAEMLERDLGEPPDPSFAEACYAATGGNPLLVMELLRALVSSSVRPRVEEIARVRAIGSVAVAPAVRRRLASLPVGARDVAAAMAVLGESVRREDLASTLGLGGLELEEMLALLERAGVVRSGQKLSFVHPLIAEAVRTSLSPAQSVTLHRDAVRALRERGASARELAPYVLASPAGSHPDAVALLREAARWAMSAGAPAAAVNYLSRAVAEEDSQIELAPLLLELGIAKVHAADATAGEDLTRAMALASDVRTRARARIELARALFATQEYMRSIELLSAGVEETAAEEPELARRMEAQLLVLIHYAGPRGFSAKQIGERMQRARATLEATPTVAGRLVLCSLSLEELFAGGAAPDAVAIADAALAGDEILLNDGPGSLSLYSAVIALIWSDELERAMVTLTAALAEARKRASLIGFVLASVWRSVVNLRLGRLLDAEADARAALEGAQQSLPGWATLAGAVLVGSLTEQGRLEEAQAVLVEVPVPDPPNAMMYFLLESRARLHLARREYAAAVSDLELYYELESPTRGVVEGRKPTLSIAAHRSLRARALIGVGDFERARALVDEEMPLARALGTSRAVGMTMYAQALLLEGEAHVLGLERASSELARSQSRLECGLALCDYGAALRRSGRRVDARGPLKAALAIAREARAAPLRDRAAAELKATGARVSRAQASGAEALTAAEQRIASMAAAGMSNREIAQALFLTIKTVESHLGHVYQKLDITRRTQLVTALGDGAKSAESVVDAELAESLG